MYNYKINIMSENQSSSSKLKIVMDKLENNALQNVKQLQKKEGIIPNGDNLISLMQKEADVFKKEMGRPMTYSEMREMFG